MPKWGPCELRTDSKQLHGARFGHRRLLTLAAEELRRRARGAVGYQARKWTLDGRHTRYQHVNHDKEKEWIFNNILMQRIDISMKHMCI